MTTQIALLVTGTLEEKALGAALERIFAGKDVQFLMRPRQDGFTSSPAPAPGAPRPPLHGQTVVEKLAKALIYEADPGRGVTAPDFVILLEDVEVCNLHQVDAVVAHFAAAVQHVLASDPEGSSKRMAQRVERVRERCSFHLVSPMIESYFFRDVAKVSGQVQLERPPHASLAAQDVEWFDVSAEVFFCAHQCERREHWSNSLLVERPRHPKRYLHYLADPQSERPIRDVYRESRQGAEILKALDWPTVFEGQGANLTLLRALIEDVADMIGCPNPYPGASSPHTTIHKRTTTLRNI